MYVTVSWLERRWWTDIIGFRMESFFILHFCFCWICVFSSYLGHEDFSWRKVLGNVLVLPWYMETWSKSPYIYISKMGEDRLKGKKDWQVAIKSLPNRYRKSSQARTATRTELRETSPTKNRQRSSFKCPYSTSNTRSKGIDPCGEYLCGSGYGKQRGSVV